VNDSLLEDVIETFTISTVYFIRFCFGLYYRRFYDSEIIQISVEKVSWNIRRIM